MCFTNLVRESERISWHVEDDCIVKVSVCRRLLSLRCVSRTRFVILKGFCVTCRWRLYRQRYMYAEDYWVCDVCHELGSRCREEFVTCRWRSHRNYYVKDVRQFSFKYHNITNSYQSSQYYELRYKKKMRCMRARTQSSSKYHTITNPCHSSQYH